MYLPQEISKARVLILVKTYPLPNASYGETVCTAGLLDGKTWVRIYPINWRDLKDDQKYPKYSWIQLDLVRNEKDFRQETYKPRLGSDEDIQVIGSIDTSDDWAARKEYILQEVFTSMRDLIELAKSEGAKSLATFKPAEIVDFTVEDAADREWKKQWLNRSLQTSMFHLDSTGVARKQRLTRKLPYSFKYKFMAAGEDRPREMTIQDWEIGALFWNCLQRAGGNEEQAKLQVRRKYLEEFTTSKDLYFFLGTHQRHHRRNAPDPFLIVGVFYPPKVAQLRLFLTHS